jgi:hypothetical protein
VKAGNGSPLSRLRSGKPPETADRINISFTAFQPPVYLRHPPLLRLLASSAADCRIRRLGTACAEPDRTRRVVVQDRAAVT